MNRKISKKNAEKKSHSRLYSFLVLIISLLCAVLLWLYVLGYDSPDFEKKFSQIPVTIIGNTELAEKTGYTVISDMTFSFDVTVSGKKTDVNSMRDTDITAYIDVSGVTTEGGIYLPVTVIVPNGITVASQSVSEAYLYIDEMVSAEIPVRIEITDYTLPENAVIGDYGANPVTVTVQGARADIEKIAEAYANVTPGELTQSVNISAPVELHDKSGAVIQTGPYLRLIDRAVNVSIPVYLTKSVPVKVHFIGGVFGVDSAVITLSREYIEVRGTASALAGIDEIAANIDETSLERVSTVVKRITLPDGVENVSGTDTVEINITLNQMGRRTVAADKSVFELRNVPDGVDVQVITQNINIVFVGPVDLMRYFTTKYFRVIIDLSGVAVESGDNLFVPVTVFINDQPGVYVSGDYSVNIIVN